MTDLIPLEMIFDTFKKTLKHKGMTYSDLATLLNMSESGIKKLFSSKDCSYQRLNEISEVLGLSFVDVLNSSQTNEVKEVHFTLEQEKYFVRHPEVFNVFWKLVQERESLSSIKKEFNLSEKQVYLTLKKLDDFGIIELHPNNKIKIPKIEKVRWMGNGPLMKWIKSEWSKKIIEDVTSKETLDSLEHFSLRYYQLSKKSHEELVFAIKELDHEFSERSLREVKSQKKLGLVRMVSAIASGSYITNEKKA